MMQLPDHETINLLLATGATIVATLTGLIGAFSTFRLQNIDNEINFLKGMILNKKFGDGQMLNDFVKGDQYYLLEKIYDVHLPAIDVLKEIIIKHDLDKQSKELLIDAENIKGNQLRYNRIKSLTITGFVISLVFVLLSLVLLVLSKEILSTGQFIGVILIVYTIGIACILSLFVVQLKRLV